MQAQSESRAALQDFDRKTTVQISDRKRLILGQFRSHFCATFFFTERKERNLLNSQLRMRPCVPPLARPLKAPPISPPAGRIASEGNGDFGTTVTHPSAHTTLFIHCWRVPKHLQTRSGSKVDPRYDFGRDFFFYSSAPDVLHDGR